MPSLSTSIVSAIKLARRVLPAGRARELPNHFGAYLAKVSWLKPVWHEFQPGLWMELNIRDLIQETILLEGVWDPILSDFIRSTLRPGDVFVDVGANAGYFALLAAQCVGASGRVLAIEPNPSVATQLLKNIQRSRLRNVITEEVACSDTLEPLVLYLHDDSNSGRASVSRGNANGVEEVEVQSTTFDRLVNKHNLQRIRLVKIDVEGAESLVLKGMVNTMQELQPLIVLELESELLRAFSSSVEAVVKFLEGFNYSVTSLGGHANFICVPASQYGPPP